MVNDTGGQMNATIPKKSYRGRTNIRKKLNVRHYGDHKNPPPVRKAVRP